MKGLNAGANPRGTRRGSWLVMLAAACTVLTACSSVPRSLVSPQVELVSLSLMESTPELQRFRASLAIRNRNDAAVPVARLRFSVRLGGEGVLTGDSTAPLTLAPLGQETLHLEVESDIVSSMSRLLALVQGPNDAIGYEINGQMTLAGRSQRQLRFSNRGLVPLSATLGTRRGAE
jgi:LEA14-like dessication related protein